MQGTGNLKQSNRLILPALRDDKGTLLAMALVGAVACGNILQAYTASLYCEIVARNASIHLSDILSVRLIRT